MTDISVIILIGQEKIHLKRCVEKLAPLNPRQIFLVESQPDDGGVAIAKETAAKFGLRLESKFNKWPGTQAEQFQWALDNLPIDASWILRLDADEYLLPELIAEIKEKLPRMDEKIVGVVLRRRHVVGWLGDKWVKHGMYPTRILRLFRRGCGKSDGKLMDEHIVVSGGVVEFENDFVDHSLISFVDWQVKHCNYAKREAQSYLLGEKSAGAKAAQKAVYYKLPRYFRAIAYFCIRYFLKGGFLDGKAGWRWNFWQGLWYRWIVDREIGRISGSGEW